MEMQRDERAAGTDLVDLMVRYQQADRAAVEELVRSISPRLLRFFAQPGVTAADAEDRLQDCWMRIHRSRHTYRPPAPVLPWIFAIARHTRLDSYRRRRRRELKEVLVAEPPEIAAPREPAVSPGPEELQRLVDGLPESQREVIVMLKVSGMSIEEVARATSSTVGAVKQKAHRAYQRLRRALGERRP